MPKEKVRDLNAESNLLKRVLDSIKQESNCTKVSWLAAAISVLALLITSMLSALAISNALEAKSKVDYELRATPDELVLLKSEWRLVEIYLQKNHVKMEALGLEPTPLPEK